MREVLNKLKERQAFLTRTIKQIEENEANYPEGRLRVRVKNNTGIYYLMMDKSDTCGSYIPRKNDDLARSLAQKEYEKKYRKQAMGELNAINRFLSEFEKYNCTGFYSKLNHIRKKLIHPFEVPDLEYEEKWREIPFEALPFRDDDSSNYITDAGERVRSKSELLIANLLFKNSIPYKYECPLKIDNQVIHPDFTVLNVRKRKVLYWEHFGMMGDAEYCNNALKKILTYSKGNMLNGDKLITTFETVNTSIDIKHINKIIRFHLL